MELCYTIISLVLHELELSFIMLSVLPKKRIKATHHFFSYIVAAIGDRTFFFMS